MAIVKTAILAALFSGELRLHCGANNYFRSVYLSPLHLGVRVCLFAPTSERASALPCRIHRHVVSRQQPKQQWLLGRAETKS